MEKLLASMDSSSYFGMLTNAAQDLVKAEQRGGPIPAKFDFGVKEACAGCKENIEPPKKVLRCAACRSVLYCSAECAKRDWKTSMIPNAPTHKALCADNKRHMQRLPETQAVVKSFPWGRVETDGSFSFDIARGRFKVLGASDHGYWSHRGGPVPHQSAGDLGGMSASVPYAQLMRTMLKSFDHLDGKDLLKKKHLTDLEGWRLSNRSLIPLRDFSAAPEQRPVLVTKFEGGVLDWDSWYKWRKLSKGSPAALLMDFPLSVYQMLVHCLKVTSPNSGSPKKRIPLNIHLLGVEVELNYLPLFSELALLLPYHDIELVVFGPGAQKLLDEAKKHPGSLAAKALSRSPEPVFQYEAPSECGSGTISVELRPVAGWSHAEVDLQKAQVDALVACNAGLGSYREWFPVIRASIVLGIPFATTEYAEQSAETQRAMIPGLIAGTGINTATDIDEAHPIELNPFHRPGQRGIPMYRMPNLVNGFTLVVHRAPGSGDTVAASMADLVLKD
ncbi:hypothetical protein PQX77_010160 [Marasmius sp. AFHP31]|nr:hypothetical protein PQX77_010160 [Marasmius sp. AFHP31]